MEDLRPLGTITARPFSLARRRGFGLIDMSLSIIVGLSTLVAGVAIFGQMAASSSAQSLIANAINLHQQVQSSIRRGERFADFPGYDEGDDRVLNVEALTVEDLETNGLSVRAPLTGPDLLWIQIARPPSGNCTRLSQRIETLGSGLVETSCATPAGPLIIEFRNTSS